SEVGREIEVPLQPRQRSAFSRVSSAFHGGGPRTDCFLRSPTILLSYIGSFVWPSASNGEESLMDPWGLRQRSAFWRDKSAFHGDGPSTDCFWQKQSRREERPGAENLGSRANPDTMSAGHQRSNYRKINRSCLVLGFRGAVTQPFSRTGEEPFLLRLR